MRRDVRFKVPDGPDVLAGIDLTINDGEFVVIVGPSGCGKTTFLNMVAGLQSFTSGHLRVAGEPPQAGRRETAYALARDALLPWRDALGNVELALQIRGVAPDERRRARREALARVGLADAATRHPAQLSQGMRQRVALARTFVTEPRLLILDEPFAALDAQTRIRMQELLLALLRQFSGTMIMVTHDIAEAIILADRVVVFSQRPATVTASYDVKLGNRQRKTSELRTDPEFSRLFERIWQDIETGVRGETGAHRIRGVTMRSRRRARLDHPHRADRRVRRHAGSSPAPPDCSTRSSSARRKARCASSSCSSPTIACSASTSATR